MRNVLRAVLAAWLVMSVPAFASDTSGVGRAGDAPPEVPETVTDEAPAKPEMNEEAEALLGGGSGEPVRSAPVEYSGFGGDELPSRE